MKLRAVLFALSFLTSSAIFGAGETNVGFATASSIPPHVIAAFAKFLSAGKYAFSAHINPFYVQGDFNGDGKLDTAIQPLQ